MNKIGEDELDNFTAALPPRDSSDKEREVPKYARIVAGARQKYFRIIRQRGANADVVTVGDADFLQSGTTTATLLPATPGAYRRYRLFHDPRLRLGLVGLGATIIGLGIDASFAIGKVAPTISVSDSLITVLMVASLLMKAGGLALAFVKGLLEV